MPLLAAGALGLGAPGAAAAPHKPWIKVETPVRSASADAAKVAASYVSLRFALPPEAGPRPERCNWINYLRFRDSAGPSDPVKAHAVFVTMPGIFAGAASLDIFARNVVRTANASGKHVEVWTLDRRSNCLEDHYGVDQGKLRRDYRLAMRYYYHGASINGRKFAGFKGPQDAQFLKAVGLEQTVRDEYAVIRRAIPRKLRTKKVLCGGHSLGGPLTAAFSAWDFDGDPKTKADAGYNQCAGYFALDTRLDSSTPGSGGGSGGGGGGGDGATAIWTGAEETSIDPPSFVARTTHETDRPPSAWSVV